jgi:formylglycine-generating enzyme required for sulfatase activity
MTAAYPQGATSPEEAARDRALDLGWRPIRPGTFTMGCAPSDRRCRPNEEPRHDVIISRPFEIMATEVTVGHFQAYSAATGYRMPRQPRWHGATHPVVNVTWEELRSFCGWAGGRLPTEAEWEYAARGGQSTVYPWGDEFDPDRANGYGRGGADRWAETAPVGAFPPNAFGLFDVVGNVWEWVHDWYAREYYEISSNQDPTGPDEGSERGLRGGSWDNEGENLRVSFRLKFSPVARYNLYIGGRCARDVAGRPAVRPG